MESLFKIIDKLSIIHDNDNENSQLEKNIIDSIVTLVIENIEGGYELYNRRINIDVNQITNSNVYQLISTEVNSNLWKLDNVICLAYEYIIKKKTKKEKYGIYYTPEWLVKYLIDMTINNYIIERDIIGNIKILEPSCGTGTFLLAAFDRLLECNIKNKDMSIDKGIKRILEENLYGVDIDSEGIKLCKYQLWIKIFKILGYLPELTLNLYNADFLKKNELDNLKFDIVIGNPPYLENRRINKYFNKEQLKKDYNTAVGRFDIYSLFIEKSINLLDDNGLIGFILPANLFSNNNFTKIRQLILEKTSIKELVNLGEKVFDEVDMNMSIIRLSNKIERDNRIKCKDIAQRDIKSRDLFLLKPKYIYQRYYNKTLNNVFDIHSSDLTFEIRERFQSSSHMCINDICEVIAGIATGNIKNKLITQNNSDNKARKILTGKDVHEYYHDWKGLYIRYDKSLIDKSQGEYATFMREEFIHREKILIRQTADRFVCTYDNEDFCLLNTLYSLILRDRYKEKINLKYILAFLNSKFNNFLYKTLIRENGKLFPQLKIYHIQKSPIRLVDNAIEGKIVNMVESLINNKKTISQNADINLRESFEIQIRNEELYKSIDDIIYKVFELSDKEVEEVEKEMGKSPLLYDNEVIENTSQIKEQLFEYKDIIHVSKKLGINPKSLYNIFITS